MNIKNIIVTITFLTFLFAAGSSLASNESPGEIIVATIDQGLKILNDPDLQSMDRIAERRQKIWDIVKTVFDFEETSKRALGRHWIPLSLDEKKEFTDAFIKILKNLYLGKTDSYQGQKIEFVREIVKDNRAKVRTNFFTINQKEIVIDFNMYKINGKWKIYDIIIEGVSIISNYRGQFNSIIAKSSFEELMKKLREKSEDIADIN